MSQADGVAQTIVLDGSGWQCKPYIGMDWLWRGAAGPESRDRRGWLPAAVPGSVQHDLWQAGEIASPYFGRNSLLLEWIPQRTWLYRTTFVVGEEHRGRRVRLHFKGVDYEAQFFLNGERLGSHRSMFTPAFFEVGDRLLYGQENLLVVVIEPAPPEQPQVGRTSLVRTHKTRMNYWWDFCPRLVHLGLWDGVQLDVSGALRLDDVWLRPELADDLATATVGVQVTLSASRAGRAALEVVLHDDEGQEVARQRAERRMPRGDSRWDLAVEVPRPCLWWPNGSGPQPLYRASVSVVELDGGDPRPSDCCQVSFGLRRVELVPNEGAGAGARGYTLLVNGQRLYLKGWNWVPMDVLYGVERPAKLERLLTLAQKAHVNLLRVWGGGLIEKEAFYDLCDRLGILVWQEFIQSSSGIENVPPDDPAFLQLLAAEAPQIVARRRSHPSLAVWCGGNELSTAAGQPLDESHPALAVLAAAVAEHDPGRAWLPTSPSGPEFNNSLEALGRNPGGMHDVHGPWEHKGLEDHFTLCNRGASLLHSEFGVEGITNRRVLDAVLPPADQWPVSLDNPTWLHLGAWWLKEATLEAAFGPLADVETTRRAAQFLQFDGLRYAVDADRRRQWRNSGSLPWQFNEPYPMAACTSAVDYYAQPKPAYYAVAAAYAPLRLSARFARQAWAGHDQFEAEAWLCSAVRDGRAAHLRLALAGLDGRVFAEAKETVTCPSRAAVRLGALTCALDGLPDLLILDLCLTAAGGELLAQERYLVSRTANLAPLLAAPTTSLSISATTQADGSQVTIANTGRTAALLVWLEDARPLDDNGYVYFDDNYFCLLPGETRAVRATWAGIPPAERRLEVSAWNSQLALLTDGLG